MSILLLSLSKADGQTIRGSVTSDGVNVFSVYDFVTRACAYRDNGACARKTYQRLLAPDSEHSEELNGLGRHFKFPGPGQRDTPVMTIRGLQRLLLILGGRVARDYRAAVETTFTRVMGGDTSLIKVIQTNASSSAPLQLAFREALAQEVQPQGGQLEFDGAGGDGGGGDARTRKRALEREDALFAMDIEERRQRMEETRHRARAQALINTQTMLDILTKLRPAEALDERTVLQIEDQTKRILLGCGGGLGAIEAGGRLEAAHASDGSEEGDGVRPPDGISVSLVAAALKIACSEGQLKEIGKRMAGRFRGEYQCDPPKHRQWIGKGMVRVNTYTERDREMMEEVIREYMVA
jgi:hypothetical protein